MVRNLKLSIDGMNIVITAQDWQKIKTAGDRALDGMTTRDRLSSGDFFDMCLESNPRAQRFSQDRDATTKTDC